MDYSFIKNLFLYKHPNGSGEIARIYFICDFENPHLYIDKLKTAFKNRSIMDSFLRYNYYIENMTTDDVPGLSVESKQRISKLCAIKDFREVEEEYVKTQNRIQFDHYLEQEREHIFSKTLILPFKEATVVPELGKLQVTGGKLKIVNNDGGVQLFEMRSF